MKKRCIITNNGAPAVGPYSHAVAAGNLLFLSGQGPFAQDGTGALIGTLEEETALTFKNMIAILEEAGASLEDVVKVTVYLADMADFPRFNALYKEYFPDECPARTCIQAGKLPMDIKVEIEAIAWLPNA